MRKAALAAFLLFGATGGWAAAYDMRDRFNDVFESAPPTLPVPAAKPDLSVNPATKPDIHRPSAADPAPAIVPTPRLRPAHDIAPVSALPETPASPSPPAPASGAGAGSPPAVPAIKPSGAIPAGYQVGISWNAMDRSWEGMFVTNTGEKPLSVVGVQLNNRNNCRLKPYNLERIQKLISLEQATKLWGSAAINLFGLPKTVTGSVLIPELPANLQGLGIAPEESQIKVGAKIVIVNLTKCDRVTVAKVDTDVGSVLIKLKRPYTGH